MREQIINQQLKIMNDTILKRPAMQTIGALLIVFFVEIFTLVSIVFDVLYVFCFFLICRQNKKTIIAVAVIISLLIIIKLLTFFSPTIDYMAFSISAITIFVIITITILALRHRKLADNINAKQITYIKDLEQMLFMTSHKIRKPIVTSLGLLNLLDNENTLNQDELCKITQNLKLNTMEMDKITRELSQYIFDLKTKEMTPTQIN